MLKVIAKRGGEIIINGKVRETLNDGETYLDNNIPLDQELEVSIEGGLGFVSLRKVGTLRPYTKYRSTVDDSSIYLCDRLLWYYLHKIPEYIYYKIV